MNTEVRLRLAKELLAELENDEHPDLIIQMLKQRLKCALVLDKNTPQDYRDDERNEALQSLY